MFQKDYKRNIFFYTGARGSGNSSPWWKIDLRIPTHLGHSKRIEETQWSLLHVAAKVRVVF